jgi:hypothetical protein
VPFVLAPDRNLFFVFHDFSAFCSRGLCALVFDSAIAIFSMNFFTAGFVLHQTIFLPPLSFRVGRETAGSSFWP